MKRLWQIVGVSCVAIACMVGADTAQAQLNQSVVASPHNLSTAPSGPASEVCVFCHTPHAARAAGDIEAPLWNKPTPDTTANPFQTYDSSTLEGTILTVGSVSAACLTCHDGTQAVDVVINAPGTDGFNAAGAQIGTATALTGVVNLSRDLTNDHPIGAPYGGGFVTPGDPAATTDPDFKTAQSGLIGGVTRYWVDTEAVGNGTREKTDMILYARADGTTTDAYVECGSCHDPHVGEAADQTNNAPGSALSFMRIANDDSAVCTACHSK